MAWGNNGNVDYQAQNITTAGNGTLTVPNGLTQLGGGLEVTDISDIGGSEIQVHSKVHFNDTVFMEADAECASILGVVGTFTADSEARLLGAVKVGPAGAAGSIDSGGSAGTPRGLNIGTGNVTTAIEISRADQPTTVNGSLTVDQASTLTGAVTAASTLKVSGAVTVGPNNAAGRIDAVPTAGGAANLIEVGGQNSTSDVKLGRVGQTIDMFGQARLNSNAMVVNGAASLTAVGGAGFVYNAVGWGNGPSIDFYLNGVMVRFVDATGWN